MPIIKHRKDFYIIPSGEVWKQFNKYFSWEVIAKYTPLSLSEDAILQSSFSNENQAMLRTSEHDIEYLIGNQWKGYKDEAQMNDMGAN